jgi:hypothetical protein
MRAFEEVTLKDGTRVKKFRKKPDPLHPGFEIVGWRWKWMAARKTEDGGNFNCKTLRKEDLKPELLKYLSDNNLFMNANTIRHGDLVLGYTMQDAYAEMRKEKDQIANEQLKLIHRTPHNSRGIKVTEAQVSRNVGADFFDEK